MKPQILIAFAFLCGYLVQSQNVEAEPDLERFGHKKRRISANGETCICKKDYEQSDSSFGSTVMNVLHTPHRMKMKAIRFAVDGVSNVATGVAGGMAKMVGLGGGGGSRSAGGGAKGELSVSVGGSRGGVSVSMGGSVGAGASGGAGVSVGGNIAGGGGGAKGGAGNEWDGEDEFEWESLGGARGSGSGFAAGGSSGSFSVGGGGAGSSSGSLSARGGGAGSGSGSFSARGGGAGSGSGSFSAGGGGAGSGSGSFSAGGGAGSGSGSFSAGGGGAGSSSGSFSARGGGAGSGSGSFSARGGGAGSGSGSFSAGGGGAGSGSGSFSAGGGGAGSSSASFSTRGGGAGSGSGSFSARGGGAGSASGSFSARGGGAGSSSGSSFSMGGSSGSEGAGGASWSITGGSSRTVSSVSGGSGSSVSSFATGAGGGKSGSLTVDSAIQYVSKLIESGSTDERYRYILKNLSGMLRHLNDGVEITNTEQVSRILSQIFTIIANNKAEITPGLMKELENLINQLSMALGGTAIISAACPSNIVQGIKHYVTSTIRLQLGSTKINSAYSGILANLLVFINGLSLDVVSSFSPLVQGQLGGDLSEAWGIISEINPDQPFIGGRMKELQVVLNKMYSLLTGPTVDSKVQNLESLLPLLKSVINDVSKSS